MHKNTSETLTGAVTGCMDLSGLLAGRISAESLGLDVLITSGRIAIGQRIVLRGPGLQEMVKVIGIESLPSLDSPKAVRIHCTPPRSFTVPDGKLEGWRIEGPDLSQSHDGIN